MPKKGTDMFTGYKIKELRDAKGMSLKDLELELYKTQGLRATYETIRQWEQGNSEPDASKLKALAEFFGVSTEFFFNSVSTN
jgi:transcriptional regulator with XRE-family HTH domain